MCPAEVDRSIPSPARRGGAAGPWGGEARRTGARGGHVPWALPKTSPRRRRVPSRVSRACRVGPWRVGVPPGSSPSADKGGSAGPSSPAGHRCLLGTTGSGRIRIDVSLRLREAGGAGGAPAALGSHAEYLAPLWKTQAESSARPQGMVRREKQHEKKARVLLYLGCFRTGSLETAPCKRHTPCSWSQARGSSGSSAGHGHSHESAPRVRQRPTCRRPWDGGLCRRDAARMRVAGREGEGLFVFNAKS